MNKQEFFDRVNAGDGEVDIMLDEDWETLQTVYNFHPMISDVNGKDEIAALYNQGGFGLIYDMLETAKAIEHNESIIQRARVEQDRLQNEFESDRADLEKKFIEDRDSQILCVEKCLQENAEIAERYSK